MMNAHDSINLSRSGSARLEVAQRPLLAAFAGPDPRRFERRLGVVLWVGLVTVLFTIGL